MNGYRRPNPGSGRKGFAVSVIVHGCLIALILFVSGHAVRRAPALTTIFLDSEKYTPQPEKAGGDRRKAGSEGGGKSAAKGTPKTVVRRAVEPASPAPSVSLTSGPPDIASVFPGPENAEPAAYEGIKGSGDGEGGGGGRGIGGYGPGSGFGGTGSDGAGGGQGKGTGAPKKADIDRYLKEHYQYIRELIVKHLAYPSMAKRMGWEGKVTVSFVITESGRAESLKVTGSSGYSVLDDNVIETIKAVQPFPRPPAPARLDIPIKYNLDRT